MNLELILSYILYAFGIYLALINLVAAIVTAYDKRISRLPRGSIRRIPEKTFVCFSMLGGGVGTLCTMLMIRHKTKEHKLLLLQIALFTAIWAALSFFLLHRLSVAFPSLFTFAPARIQ